MTSPVTPAAAPPPPGSFGALELLLGALAALGPLSVDMYLPAFPTIADEYLVPTAAVALSLATFFIGFSVGQLIAGPIVDRLGRKRPLMLALALYLLASLACALAPSNDLLIAARLLQGLAGSVAVVVPRAIVRDLRSGPDAVHMLSRLMLVMGVAPIVAPLLGGWVLHAFGWRAIFLVLAGFGALMLLACHKLLPETGRPAVAHRPLSTQLSALLREPDFRTYTLCGAFSSAGMFAYISGSAFIFIEIHHVPAEHYGWFFGANAFGLIAASQLNRLLVGRFTSTQVLGAATSLAALASLVVLAVAWTGAGGLWGIAGALFVFVSTLGILGPNTTALALEGHPERAGLASALLGSLQFMIAAAAAWAVSLLHDQTAVPMAAVVAVSACLAWLMFMTRRRPSHPAI